MKVKHSPLLLLFGLALLSHQVRADEPPASPCFHETPIRIPKDKLVFFGSPNRIPRAYIVEFKCDKALAQTAKDSAAHRSQVLRNTLPTSQENCAAIASAYVARFGGKVVGVWCRPRGTLRGFGIHGISKKAIADLAQDDRVEYVEPDVYGHTAQSLTN
jgi:hypothetical protein